VQGRDHGDEVGRLELVDRPAADQRQQLVEVNPVLLASRVGDVDAGGPPVLRGLRED
jgi:hypothetical protein